jgi:hypothetical protein
MKLPLKLLTLCSLGAFSFTATQALAQTEQPASPPVAMEQQATEVTDEELQKFAEIYVDVETTRIQLSEEMTQAESPEDAQAVQTRFEQELVGTIEEHGWTVDDYNRVATAISNDPEKREKAVELINRIVS